MLSQAVQDYLKIIYKLQDKGPVPTTEIAKELNVSGASVTGMLKRLDTMGFVDYNSYKGVKLSENGEKIALEILRHHRLIELYLKEMMNFPLEKIHEEACRLEHHVSEDFINRITDILGDPKFDPHGHPIPTKEGELPELNEHKLSEIEPVNTIKISRISDHDNKLLAYLEQIGLIPGVVVTVKEKEPFNGPITISYNEKEKVIGNEIATNIYVIK